VLACCAAGLPAEIDVRRSRDGEAVVIHDRALERLTGARGRVEEHAAVALCRLRLLGTRERVPLLRDVLDAVGGRVPLLIELKAAGGRGSALERAVLAALDGYRGEVAIQSFARAALWRLGRQDVPHAVGHLSCGYVPVRGNRRAAFLGCHVRALPAGAVQRRRAAGAIVLAWTVCSPEHEAWARRLADNVIFEGYVPEAGALGHRLSSPGSGAPASP